MVLFRARHAPAGLCQPASDRAAGDARALRPGRQCRSGRFHRAGTGRQHQPRRQEDADAGPQPHASSRICSATSVRSVRLAPDRARRRNNRGAAAWPVSPSFGFDPADQQLVDLAVVHVHDLERPALIVEHLALLGQVAQAVQHMARGGRVIAVFGQDRCPAARPSHRRAARPRSAGCHRRARRSSANRLRPGRTRNRRPAPAAGQPGSPDLRSGRIRHAPAPSALRPSAAPSAHPSHRPDRARSVRCGQARPDRAVRLR